MLETQRVLEELRAGTINASAASEMNNCVGKMIGLAKVELEYRKLREEKPTMAFFK